MADSNNLYTSWGILTGEDEEGNPVYSWADSENAATDGRGSIDEKGHYTVVGGGESVIALMVRTGYYLPTGSFYEISSLTKTFNVTNGIPVESIKISVNDAVGIASSLIKNETVTVNGQDYTYATVRAGT